MTTTGPGKKLYKNPGDAKIAGVCSGVAEFFGLDVTLVRVVWALTLLIGGLGFWIYVILWIALDDKPAETPAVAPVATQPTEPPVAPEPEVADEPEAEEVAPGSDEPTSTPQEQSPEQPIVADEDQETP